MNKLKKREELSGAFLPRIMLSPSTELHSCGSSSCSNLPFLSQLTTHLECSPQTQRHPISRPLLSIPPMRPPICPREMLDVRLLTRVWCWTTAAAFSVTQHAVDPPQRKPVIYSLLHIHSGRERQRIQLRWKPCLTGGACLPLALSHILGLGIS